MATARGLAAQRYGAERDGHQNEQPHQGFASAFDGRIGPARGLQCALRLIEHRLDLFDLSLSLGELA